MCVWNVCQPTCACLPCLLHVLCRRASCVCHATTRQLPLSAAQTCSGISGSKRQHCGIWAGRASRRGCSQGSTLDRALVEAEGSVCMLVAACMCTCCSGQDEARAQVANGFRGGLLQVEQERPLLKLVLLALCQCSVVVFMASRVLLRLPDVLCNLRACCQKIWSNLPGGRQSCQAVHHDSLILVRLPRAGSRLLL